MEGFHEYWAKSGISDHFGYAHNVTLNANLSLMYDMPYFLQVKFT